MPLKLSHGMGVWIKDFQKSDAPQFKGKSDKERRDQAIAAYMSAKRDVNEAVEYDSGWKKSPQDRKDQYGNPVKAKNVPKKLAKMGMKQHDKDDKKKNEGVEEGGLWTNIHAKRKRIKNGSGERMRKPGSKGAPTDKDFKDAQESVQHKSFFDLREATKCNKVKEGTIDELSKATLGSYAKKASRTATVDRKIAGDFENQANKSRTPSMKAASQSLADKWKSKAWKRLNNIDKAIDRVTKEEVEQVNELSQNTLRNYHGKSALDIRKKRDQLNKGTLSTADHKKAQRRVTGINRAANKMEEVEQVNELSKSTLRSYIDKKSDDHESNRNAVADARDALRKHQKNKPSLDAPLKHQFDHSEKKRELEKDANAASRTATRSNVNILKAKKRLNKEEIEQVDELSNDMLQRYKKNAGQSARDADKKGDIKTGNKRFSGIMKATTKQFKNDLKKESDESWEKGQEKEKEKKLTSKDQKTLAQLRALMNREKK